MIFGDFHILKMRSFHWNVAFPIRFSAAQCGFRQEGLMKRGPGRSRHQLMGLVSPVIHGLKPRNGDLPESSLSASSYLYNPVNFKNLNHQHPSTTSVLGSSPLGLC